MIAFYEKNAFRFGKNKSPPKVIRKQSEGLVLNAAIRWLMAHKVYCWRNNSGGYKSETGTWIRYGFKGSPDILGLMPVTSRKPGVFLGVECKTESGTLQESQIAFRQHIESDGGLYFVVRSLDDLETQLKPLLQ